MQSNLPRCLVFLSGKSVLSPMSHLLSVLQRCNRFAVVLNGSRRLSTTRLSQGYDSEGVMNEQEKREALRLRMHQRDEMFSQFVIPKGAVYGIIAFIALMFGMVSLVKRAEEAADAVTAKSEKEQLRN
ncbi:hypothetical protein DdX_15135 [Ditylenchus destructor]|uniref:Uncharacterized protein n=1 Tax=Ditylenchus destructor TaxID=166010 RepID=A0AAD4QY10_9BILA|nr:hypothetical protein DdX_15135 [Ditylenchus destructor]